MRLNRLALALSAAMFALPMSAMAQDAAAPADQANEAPEAAVVVEEAASNFSWNLGVTSDYVFRGITQTDFDPALQGGLDYAFGDSGWYIGTWASNVDFVSVGTPDIELDAYFGWGTEIAEDWTLDLHAIRYFYLGESDGYGSLDYNEYFAKVSYAEMLTFTVAYANDYANQDYSSTYFGLTGAFDIGHGFSLNAGVGHSDFSNDVGNYTDYNIGVSRSFGPVEAALTYYDTTGDYADSLYGGDNTSDSFVISFKIGG